MTAAIGGGWLRCIAGSAMVETNERLARVQRSIAEVEADGRPARLKILLLTALRRERDALLARQEIDLPATKKPL